MTILVIDDSRFLQLGIQKALQQGGYRTLMATDGEQGVRMAVERRPDLILLDIMLPGLPGTTVLHSLKRNSITSSIPVIVLTGLTRLDEGKLKHEGADGYLKKSDLGLQEGGQPLLHLIEAMSKSAPKEARSN
ncbi:MAG TPA: response regulator [Terriglobales bacterium]|nr:response regulator [Terriglobales bacterium]